MRVALVAAHWEGQFRGSHPCWRWDELISLSSWVCELAISFVTRLAHGIE